MIQTNCHTCKKIIQKSERDFKKSKSGFHFCSKSCSAIYSNTLRIKLPQEVCKCCNKNLTKRYRKELVRKNSFPFLILIQVNSNNFHKLF